MDPYQRGRSPSAGNSENIRRSPSPSTHSAFTSQANAFGYDPSLLGPANGTTTNFTDPLSQHLSFTQANFNQSPYSQPDLSYLQHQQQQQQQQQQSQQPQHHQQLSNQSRTAQSYQYMNQADKTQNPGFANSFLLQDQEGQNQSFDGFGDAGDDLDQDFESFQYVDFDNPVIENQAAASLNNNSSSNSMATHQRTPDPPHLLQPDNPQAQSSSNQSSPSFYQENEFNPANNSRPNSLSPANAVFFPATSGGDYTGMSFQNHRRHPSDQHSDISSTHASPYLPNSDHFEPQPSPTLNPTSDPSMIGPDNLGLNAFTISDPQHISPGHSSHPSPHLGAQSVPLFQGSEGLGLLGVDAQRVGMRQADSFSGPEMFPPLQASDSQDMGQASQMSPPEIKLEPAPESRNFTDTTFAEHAGGTLGPPERVSSRNRQRSSSAPYASGPSSRESSRERPRSPSMGTNLQLPESQAAWSRPRSPSPSHSGRIEKNRRSSSPVVPNINQETLIAQVQDSQSSQASYTNDRGVSPAPSIPNEGSLASSLTGPKPRVQKHPATYSCTLCTKRFTRAYNLRSHLRTHTDERPFVCSVCGKAFARQHDRKRHEELHSGEKKFVCRGTLSSPNSGTWGCGRRFARADALGRHFRSEAGRTCIKPLLDEEARERRAMMVDQANQSMMMGNAGQHAMMQQVPNPAMPETGAVDLGGMALPAALLQQYPALAEIQWNAPPAAARRSVGSNGNVGDGSGTSDFEESDYALSDYGESGEWDYMSQGSFGPDSTTGDFGYEDEDAGYVSSSAIDPRYATGAGPWSLASGQSNGYYSDNGGR